MLAEPVYGPVYIIEIPTNIAHSAPHNMISAATKIHRHGGVSGSALACGASKSCWRPEFESHVKRTTKFKKVQTAVSTTERYFTLSVVCLIVECTRRQHKGD